MSALEAASDGERLAVLLVDYHLGEHRENGIDLAARCAAAIWVSHSGNYRQP